MKYWSTWMMVWALFWGVWVSKMFSRSFGNFGTFERRLFFNENSAGAWSPGIFLCIDTGGVKMMALMVCSATELDLEDYFHLGIRFFTLPWQSKKHAWMFEKIMSFLLIYHVTDLLKWFSTHLWIMTKFLVDESLCVLGWKVSTTFES